MSDNLSEIITKLLQASKEGDHWDFKQVCPSSCSILHDIICLANNPYYEGDQYLIFGVSDDCKVVGLHSNTIKERADIIDTLRNANY